MLQAIIVCNFKEGKKNLVLGPIFVQIWLAKLFFNNLASSVTRYHGQPLSCTILENTNDPILIKLSDGRTDRQTGEQTDESDFIGRCLTNVERPIQ